MKTWNEIPDAQTLQKTAAALAANGMTPIIVQNGNEAKQKVLTLIPQGAEVMTMTSVTLDSIGVVKELNESGKYQSVKAQLQAMDRVTQGVQMQKLGTAAQYAVGSVHAVTQDGQVLIASNTGSQLSAYVYGSSQVIWVVGAQKVVQNVQDGIERIEEYILPKESARARKAYQLPDTWNSFVSKLLIINREVTPHRITILLVKEILGF